MSDKKVTIRDFEKNEVNPFVSKAVEEIAVHTKKKWTKSTSTDKKAIFKAVNDNGEVVGSTSFLRQIKVDDEQFTKFYISHFQQFFDLKKNALKCFGYIMKQLIPNKDFFYFDIQECEKHTGYTRRTIHQGMAGLLKAGIIARGKNDYQYYINPMVVFNGNRVTFATEYIRSEEEKKALKGGTQIDLEDSIAEIKAEKIRKS